MLEKVQPRVDFIRVEHEMLDFWRSEKIFRARMTANQGNRKWSFIDGPITANNPMGVHHAWGRTYKDIFQRFHAMKGYDQRYQNGFDCQGLWVEVEVEKELGFKSKTDIEEFGIENFVNACKDRVDRFSKIQTDQSIRLGYWMDWENSYYTMSDENNYTIWSFLKQCHKKGWIYKGNDVLPWCIDCGAALSEHEIATEGYAERRHLSLYVRFPLKDAKNESLLIWTTTPWTLSSNVAAAVHPEMTYVKVEQGDEILYLSESRIHVLESKGKYRVVDRMKGVDLLGTVYLGPFDDFQALEGVQHSVLSWDEVNADEGTGIVHVAPGCGHEDLLIAQESGLPVVAPLDQFGDFIDGFGWLSGKSVRDVGKEIVEALEKGDQLYRQEYYTHRYPICWRHKTDLVFRLVDEWFISMDEFRHDIMAVAKEIRWIPEWGLASELDWLRNMDDWMISKKRYWGLSLPIYECEECGHLIVIGSKEELQERAVEGWDEFEGHSPHRPWVDAVKIRCEDCGATVSRIPDVGNPWLDAGIVPYSTLHYVTDRDYWKEWFPADFITENLAGQFRNWFYSLLAMSAALEQKPPFKTVLGHALVKDEHGRDMHKSSGNAIWFDDAAEQMGVDVMRWMFAEQNPEQNLRFGYGSAKEIRKRLITLWNVYSFFVTYARLDRFDPNEPDVDQFTELDRWITARMNRLIQVADNSYKSFRVDRFMKQVDRFLNDLSNWYVRRNRRRFWKSENDSDKNAAYFTLYDVVKRLIMILAPVLPFVTEKIYQNLIRNLETSAPKSVHLCDFPPVEESLIDDDIIREIDTVVKIVELGRYARNKANLKVRQPLAKLQYATDDKNIAEAIHRNKDQILEELNVKEVEQVESVHELIRFSIKPNLAVLGKRLGSDLNQVREMLEDLSYEEIQEELEKHDGFTLSNNGKSYRFSKDEIVVETTPHDGKSAVSESSMTVAVTTELTPHLIQEGLVRDMIRQVQNMRKEANFEVEDRIAVTCELTEESKSALEAFEDYFRDEVLAAELRVGNVSGEYTKEIMVGGEKMAIGIERIPNN
ncbi:MAG: isoleucine--tRNA ligase [Candidatus Neomarinimicrobiota bacterium]